MNIDYDCPVCNKSTELIGCEVFERMAAPGSPDVVDTTRSTRICNTHGAMMVHKHVMIHFPNNGE